MELRVKPENSTSYIYMDLRLATLKAVPFYLLHNVSTLNKRRKCSCVTVVCKHNCDTVSIEPLVVLHKIFKIPIVKSPNTNSITLLHMLYNHIHIIVTQQNTKTKAP
jgi:hypothetical protein